LEPLSNCRCGANRLVPTGIDPEAMPIPTWYLEDVGRPWRYEQSHAYWSRRRLSVGTHQLSPGTKRLGAGDPLLQTRGKQRVEHQPAAAQSRTGKLPSGPLQ